MKGRFFLHRSVSSNIINHSTFHSNVTIQQQTFYSMSLKYVVVFNNNYYIHYTNISWIRGHFNLKSLPASRSISCSCSADFIALSFWGTSVQIFINESANPTANRLESSDTSALVTLRAVSTNYQVCSSKKSHLADIRRFIEYSKTAYNGIQRDMNIVLFNMGIYF